MDNSPRRSKRLGKGLSALIPEINEEVDKKDIIQIKLKNIRPNKNQPRKEFNQDKIKSLSESIKNVGVLQPIVLKPTDEDNYMIIAGERRYRASIMAGKEEIPAVIKDIPIKDIMEIALIENLQRENLNAIGMFVLAICNNLLALGMMFSSGVGSAVMSIGGFLLGQHDMQGLRILVQKSVKLLLVCLIVVVGVIEIFPDVISNIFGANSPELLAYSNQSVRIFVLMLPTILLVLMLANVYQMLGFLVLTPIVILTFPLTLIPNLYFWSGCIGQEYLWWAFPATGLIVLLVTFVITEIFRARKRNLSVLTLVSTENVEHSLNVSVKADREGVTEVLPEVSSFLSSLELDKKRVLSSNLCIEEIMLNIVDHGGERMSDHYFDLHICSLQGKLHISIKDDGIPFNPISTSIEQRRIGLNLVHGFCEKIEYKYMYGQNMIFLTWTINN